MTTTNTYRVTFKANDVFQAHIAHAPSTEAVNAWYAVNKPNYEIIDVVETCETPKPGQPVIEIEDQPEAETVNVRDLLNDLDLGDYGDQMNDYRNSDTYVCDAISEIADSNTSIYYSDIHKFIAENTDALEDAINEYGWEGCGRDLMKAGQMAEYNTIQGDLYEHLGDTLKCAAYNLLIYDLGMDEAPAELIEAIDEMAEEEDDNATMEAIPGMITEWLEEHREA